MVATFAVLDVLVLGAYFSIHASVAAYFTPTCGGRLRRCARRARRRPPHELLPDGGVAGSGETAGNAHAGAGTPASVPETAASYFLAGRHAPWWAVAASFFASNIGSETLVGLAGNGARYGMSVATFDWASPLFFVLLGWVFSPLYTAAGVFTTNEWVQRRFSLTCRTYLAVGSLVLYVVTKLSMSLIAGGVVLQSLLGWNMWVSIVTLVCVTGAYVVSGGMSAVIYTEVVQTVVLLLGSFLLMTLSLREVGGVSGLRASVDSSFLHVLTTDGPYPWLGLLFGYPFLSMWFHCTDQEMVQRSLTAKVLPSKPHDLHAKAGCVLAGFLKLLPPFGFAVAGIVARVLYPAALGIGCQAGDDGCGPGFDVAFPVLVERLMPPGALGLMVAAMLAALMSTLASTFNSSSTIFTVDVYQCLRPGASQAELVRVGRGAACAMVLLAIAWVPVVYSISDTLYLAVQSVVAVAAPPIAVLFLLGVFVPRVNATGGLCGMVAGHVLGVVRLAVTMATSRWQEHGFVHDFTHFNFLEFAAVEAAVAGAVMLLVSVTCSSTTRTTDQLAGLTWSTRKAALASGPGPDETPPPAGEVELATTGATRVGGYHGLGRSASGSDAAHLLSTTASANPPLRATADGDADAATPPRGSVTGQRHTRAGVRTQRGAAGAEATPRPRVTCGLPCGLDAELCVNVAACVLLATVVAVFATFR